MTLCLPRFRQARLPAQLRAVLASAFAWICFVSVAASGMSVMAQAPAAPQQTDDSGKSSTANLRMFREWDGFQVGAWKQVRVLQQTLREDGTVDGDNLTETRTTLTAADAQGFTLQIETTIEVANKRFQSQPQVIWYGYNGQTKEMAADVDTLGSETLLVDGQEIPVDIHRIQFDGGQLQREVTVHATRRFPFVFRRRTRVWQRTDDKPVEVESVSADTIALGMPFIVQGEIKPTCHVKTILRRADMQVHTIEVHCEDVPGRVVAHWSKQLDQEGKVRQRSTLELVDYGLGGN